jgi:hypothetical protein
MRAGGLLLRFTRHVGPVLAAALFASACESQETTTTVTAPTPVTKTDTFAGRVAPNGAVTFTFTTAAGGLVNGTLKAVEFVTPPPAPPEGEAPVAVPAIGIALGRWDTATSACTLTVTTNQAVAGSVISGAASGAGTLCLRVYDSGSVAAPLTFSVDVEHP